ncbi:hypothetical protein [Microbispora sp. CA-102843]|uniref:hypothetical protein n=1 Tax=Microbispora sp. CA-102843 TaxID=3239952 RepID=UPI003D939D83
MSAPAIPIPYVLAYADEAVPQPLIFTEPGLSGEVRLEFIDPRPSDRINGVLRVRVRTNMRGAVRWRKLNARRQWECLRKNLCQVCKRPATDADGRLPWLLTEKVYQPIADDRYGTTAPPTCRECIPLSLAHCPQLNGAPTLCTAAYAEPVGVLGDLYRCGPRGEAFLARENVYADWGAAALPRILARLAVVELRDMEPEPLP